MRTRRALEHDAAVARRLSQLGEELSAHRGGVRPARPQPPPGDDPTQAPWWDDHTRPAAPRRPAGAPPPVRPVPPDRPPGRHAAPRPAGPFALGAAQLAAVAVLVAGALAVTCWWLVRGSPSTVPTVAVAPGPATGTPVLEPVRGADPGDSALSPGAAASTPATVTVDIAGKVRHPGIVVLDAGARVVDGVEAAGGARPGVDLTGLNLARVLVDGEQVVVGGVAPSGAAAAASSPPPAAGSVPGTLVNLNTATEEQLDTLPDVGPVTAASILAWREQHGGFSSVDELLEVDGIGELTLDKLAPFVTV